MLDKDKRAVLDFLRKFGSEKISFKLDQALSELKITREKLEETLFSLEDEGYLKIIKIPPSPTVIKQIRIRQIQLNISLLLGEITEYYYREKWYELIEKVNLEKAWKDFIKNFKDFYMIFKKMNSHEIKNEFRWIEWYDPWLFEEHMDFLSAEIERESIWPNPLFYPESQNITLIEILKLLILGDILPGLLGIIEKYDHYDIFYHPFASFYNYIYDPFRLKILSGRFCVSAYLALNKMKETLTKIKSEYELIKSSPAKNEIVRLEKELRENVVKLKHMIEKLGIKRIANEEAKEFLNLLKIFFIIFHSEKYRHQENVNLEFVVKEYLKSHKHFMLDATDMTYFSHPGEIYDHIRILCTNLLRICKVIEKEITIDNFQVLLDALNEFINECNSLHGMNRIAKFLEWIEFFTMLKPFIICYGGFSRISREGVRWFCDRFDHIIDEINEYISYFLKGELKKSAISEVSKEAKKVMTLNGKIGEEEDFEIRLTLGDLEEVSPREPVCPYCGEKLHFLFTLGKYYCFNCKSYIAVIDILAMLELPGGERIFVTEPVMVFGREDFQKYLSKESCILIRRKSKGHFKIVSRYGRFYIQDLGSVNGTLLNGKEISGKGFVELKDGDIISPAGVINITFKIRSTRFS